MPYVVVHIYNTLDLMPYVVVHIYNTHDVSLNFTDSQGNELGILIELLVRGDLWTLVYQGGEGNAF